MVVVKDSLTVAAGAVDLLEKGGGWDIGHKPMGALKALRLRCLDCCAGSACEVRKCTAVSCPSWPFRMGRSPWRAEPSEAQREVGVRLAAKRRAWSENQRSSRCSATNSDPSATPLPVETMT